LVNSLLNTSVEYKVKHTSIKKLPFKARRSRSKQVSEKQHDEGNELSKRSKEEEPSLNCNAFNLLIVNLGLEDSDPSKAPETQHASNIDQVEAHYFGFLSEEVSSEMKEFQINKSDDLLIEEIELNEEESTSREFLERL